MNHTGHVHHPHDPHEHHHQMVTTTSAPAALHDSHHQHASHDHAGHVMKMWFHGGCNEVILFDWWRTESCVGLIVSCIFVFFMAAFYEAIKWVRVYLQAYASSRQRCSYSSHNLANLNVTTTNDALIEKSVENTGTLKSDDVYKSTVTREARPKPIGLDRLLKYVDVHNSSPFSPFRIIQTTLYCLQLTLAYWLMLIAMTYNVYLTAVVVLGAGFGHWLFAILRKMPAGAEKQDAFASDACH